MKLIPFIISFFLLGFQQMSAQKKALMTRVTQYLDIRNTVTEDKAAEITRIKSYLIPSKNPDSLAQIRYSLWKDELDKFGTDKNRILKVQFLQDQTIAIVKTQKIRTYPVKKGKEKSKTKSKQVSFKFTYTWEKLDEVWYLRNVILTETPT